MNTKLESALATLKDGESRSFGTVTLHVSKDGLAAWASGSPDLSGNYLHTDADECARVETLLSLLGYTPAAPAAGEWKLRASVDDRGWEYGFSYRICDAAGKLVCTAESESIARSIVEAYNTCEARRTALAAESLAKAFPFVTE